MNTSLIRTAAVLFFAFTILSGSGSISTAGAASEPSEELVLQGKKPARFNHKTHTSQGIECGTCHHDSNHTALDEEAIRSITDTASLKCLSCHNDQHLKEELRRAKDVFHTRCKTCHQEGWQGKHGPTKCLDCHLKTGKAPEGC